MVDFYIALTGCMMFVEYQIVSHSPRMRDWLSANLLKAMLFSTALSAVSGTVFGAGGLVFMAASLTSTVLMMPIYKLLRGRQIDAAIAKWHAIGQARDRNWVSICAVGHDVAEIGHTLGHIIQATVVGIAAVIRAIAWSCRKINTIGTAVGDTRKDA